MRQDINDKEQDINDGKSYRKVKNKSYVYFFDKVFCENDNEPNCTFIYFVD